MHTQHVKFSAYALGGDDVGGLVPVGVVFEEGEVFGMEEADDDVNGSVLDDVVVVVFGWPSASFFILLLVLLLDFIWHRLDPEFRGRLIFS